MCSISCVSDLLITLHAVRLSLMAQITYIVHTLLVVVSWQEKLTQLQQWIGKVHSFDKVVVSSNGILHVDCSVIRDGLSPRLREIYNEHIDFVVCEAKVMSSSFLRDMNTISEVCPCT